MKLQRIIGCALAVMAIPAIAAAQKTTYDYDKTAPFAQFKSGLSTGVKHERSAKIRNIESRTSA